MDNRVRRALVSVFDKQGIAEFGRVLAAQGVEILSSGGTARLLEKEGLEVVRVSDYTGSPEMLDGRVKTLHPRIHAGILAARSNTDHMDDLKKYDIGLIDLVVVNLYPFQKTASTEGIGVEDAIEMIDIGGPTMVRAAAKNHQHIGVIVDPADYEQVGEELARTGELSAGTRTRLAIKAFRVTSAYDSAVSTYLNSVEAGKTDEAGSSPFPETLHLEFVKAADLRYGENPHQRAAFYRDPLSSTPSIGSAEQLQGKELSFNNILDLDAALALAAELNQPACVIVKHGNPCGAAVGEEPRVAFDRARACDPTSAFGGVIAFNRKVDGRTAEAIAPIFFEAVVAPQIDAEARQVLAKKKKLRLLEVADLARYASSGFDLRRVNGGLLAQDWDARADDARAARVVTERQPTEQEWRALQFGWTVCGHVKSNAIVYAAEDRTLGIGAGQMSRVDSARIGMQKAESSLEGAAMASDAFFPFRDGVDVAAEAGIKAVIQPGGSIRDDEVIAAANEHGMTMVLTGRRHFRH